MNSTSQQLQETATTMRELYGYKGTQDLIQALQESLKCPLGNCDGSGKIETYMDDGDGHQVPDSERDCECGLEE